MKHKAGWLTLFFAAIAAATLFQGFICRLVSGDFICGVLLITALFLPKLLDWIWHLPLRPIDISISCDPLKPNASELCQHVREIFRRVYSDGGNYLVYIAPMPNTGMRIAFNLVKQRIEARCGSERFGLGESNYQLPPFAFDESPVVYRLSGREGEHTDGVYLYLSAERGKRIQVSKLRVNKHAITIADISLIGIAALLDIWPMILCAIILRKSNISNATGYWRFIFIIVSIAVVVWQMYSFNW